MKKYEKPVLVFESYELSYNVANCSPALNHGETEMGCSIKIIDGVELEEAETVFTASVNCGCGESIWEHYCKFTGADIINVFTS